MYCALIVVSLWLAACTGQDPNAGSGNGFKERAQKPHADYGLRRG